MYETDALWVGVSVLAVWRVTHLVHAERGPWDVLGALRRAAARLGAAGVVDCFYCLSLWVALPLAAIAADDWVRRATLWFALSGGAILLHRLTGDRTTFDPPWREADAAPSPADRSDGPNEE
jgi:hypothetical protein